MTLDSTSPAKDPLQSFAPHALIGAGGAMPLEALSATQVIAALAKIDGWTLHGDGTEVAIQKVFRFKNFLRTMAFVNAVAYVAEQQNHHPELLVAQRSCSVRFNTHDAGGITRADFACAALVDALVPATAPLPSSSHSSVPPRAEPDPRASGQP